MRNSAACSIQGCLLAARAMAARASRRVTRMIDEAWDETGTGHTLASPDQRREEFAGDQLAGVAADESSS